MHHKSLMMSTVVSVAKDVSLHLVLCATNNPHQLRLLLESAHMLLSRIRDYTPLQLAAPGREPRCRFPTRLFGPQHDEAPVESREVHDHDHGQRLPVDRLQCACAAQSQLACGSQLLCSTNAGSCRTIAAARGASQMQLVTGVVKSFRGKYWQAKT